MSQEPKRDQWLEDVNKRQRNLVFPDNVQNEARFWRNLANSPWKTSTKIGMSILAVFVFAWIATIIVASLQEGFRTALALLLAMILFCGPIFAVIAWATRRNLQNIERTRREHRSLPR
jgi:hypothetical protein